MTDQIQIDFDAFHADHPEVYDYFRKFAWRMIALGFKHGSAKLIFERIRWEIAVELQRDPVRLNNNYTSRYARKFEADQPHYRGFFRLRKLDPNSVNSTSRAEVTE